MEVLENRYRAVGLEDAAIKNVPLPSDNVVAPLALLQYCPSHKETPLARADDLLGTGAALFIKDERTRMGLGSFKALGAAYVIAHDAQAVGGDMRHALNGRTYVTASAGNHGMSVAAGARIFGARAVVYLGAGVPESFAKRLRDKGAEVVRAGEDYEASMRAAQEAADKNGWTLLSDSSWPGYIELPHRLMEGYLVMGQEIIAQMPSPPTHIFLQAGVGGLAGAMARIFRKAWGDAPQIIVVEPEFAPALIASIKEGRCVETAGPESIMGRLDCKTPSLIALKGLALDADSFVTISETESTESLPRYAQAGFATTASGGAGISAAILMAKSLGADARVLTILSETTD